MRCAFLTTLLFLSITTLARAEEPATVRVGAWNLNWLGEPERRGGVAQKPEDIAKYIAASKVSVLALNEVSANPTGVHLANKTLTDALEMLTKQSRQEWRYIIFPRLDSQDRVLLTGVAWNSAKVKLVGKPFQIPIRRSREWASIWNRQPHAVKLSLGAGKTDLVLIPVHMKSNIGGYVETSRQRAQEARTLIRSLGTAQINFQDDDVLILGDFNTRLGSEPAQQRFLKAGFRDLNHADELTWIKNRRYPAAPFDRILVPEDQPETEGCRMTVFKEHHLGSEEKFRAVLSDHYLVYTDVRVMKDDDGEEATPSSDAP